MVLSEATTLLRKIFVHLLGISAGDCPEIVKHQLFEFAQNHDFLRSSKRGVMLARKKPTVNRFLKIDLILRR